MKRALMLLVLVAGCEKKETPESKPKPPEATRAPDAAVASAELVVETDRFVLRGQVIGPDDLVTALGAGTGELVVGVAPDATYQRLVDALDAATRAGRQPVLELGDGQGTEDLTPRAVAGVA